MTGLWLAFDETVPASVAFVSAADFSGWLAPPIKPLAMTQRMESGDKTSDHFLTVCPLAIAITGG